MQNDTKYFYDKLQFPGPYLYESLTVTEIENRYLYTMDTVMNAGQTVLDVGCGTGLIPNLFAIKYPTSQFVGVDFADSINYACQFSQNHQITNVKFINTDFFNYTTTDQFDVVICQGVLHHIRNFSEALTKIKNLTKPGGIIIIGLYHPWGKILKKLRTINYHSEILKIDQEDNVYETAFNCSQVTQLFSGYQLLISYPTVVPVFAHVMSLIHSANGGLITYIWKKPD